MENHTEYRQNLGDQVNNVEQEARMVLPGIQALFGFQLVVAFSADFKLHTTQNEQYLHLVALILVAFSGVLTVAPAAYHRQADHQISEHFVKVSSRFLTWALAPLAIGTCLDIYLVSRIILESVLFAQIVSGFIFLIYFGIWFAFPWITAKRKRRRS